MKPRTTLDSIMLDRRRRSVERTNVRPDSAKIVRQPPYKVKKLS